MKPSVFQKRFYPQNKTDKKQKCTQTNQTNKQTNKNTKKQNKTNTHT